VGVAEGELGREAGGLEKRVGARGGWAGEASGSERRGEEGRGGARERGGPRGPEGLSGGFFRD
jgi:hypothetical protein